MSTDSEYYQLFAKHNVCVIIPTYNNAKTLAQVIESVLAYTDQVIVVNDGATDSSLEIISRYPVIKLVSYEKNQGKGYALRRGFRYAEEAGYDYAITIDSDGQHFAKDLPVFIQKLEEIGPALMIGARNMDQASVPGKSSFGNKFSNFWFWVETGIKMPDTQSGYRLYPLCKMKNMRFLTRKYEFEIEVIVKSAWRSIPVVPVPVSVYYAPGKERITHFRPFKDFTRISILNTFLVTWAFLYIKPRDFLRRLFNKNTYRSVLDELFHPQDSNELKAVSIAFGVFMGIVPLWGFQLILAIFLAIVLRLNKALVIISANISIPPMIPLIIFLSYKMGEWWMGAEAVHLSFDSSLTLEKIGMNFIQYIYGSISLAVVASLASGLITYTILSIIKFTRKATI